MKLEKLSSTKWARVDLRVTAEEHTQINGRVESENTLQLFLAVLGHAAHASNLKL